MTSLRPRPPYSDAELKKLYPDNVELRLVQVLLRHGERAPVSIRFQNVSILLDPPQVCGSLVTGRTSTILAILQCRPAITIRRHGSEWRTKLGFLTMEEET